MARFWTSYVYALTKDDQILYIGKGTTTRLRCQKARFGLDGHEIARFKTERDAYSFERQIIQDINPWLNRCPGGAGSYAHKQTIPKYKPDETEILINQIGTRAYSARLLLWCKNNGLCRMDEKSELFYRALGYGIQWVEQSY